MASHGKKGATGARGPRGARGLSGKIGPPGKSGKSGQKGSKGLTGSKGRTGPVSIPPDIDEATARLDRIQALADELAKSPSDVLDQMDLSKRIYNEIQAAKIALKPTL